ncbi:MAG TPA: DUF4349 domain-containing protein [Solirubrobacteraceae bacterium]|jgi:hypothetical protein|nr:DUF4349 domain-containing protein [Solirubrobacteraceae bacterium]
MKIVPLPRRRDPHGDALVAELEAALSGESSGAEAESWRELRGDVRALAPPMSAELERELWARIEQRSAPQLGRAPLRSRSWSSPRAMLAALGTWLASGLRARLLAGSAVVALVSIGTVAIVAPWRGAPLRATTFEPESAQLARPNEPGAGAGPVRATARKHSANVPYPSAEAAASSEATSSASAASSPPRRVQQLGASLTLAPRPGAVQSVASEVAQLATRDGGFVKSSHVNLQHGASSEANLQLSLPSAGLQTALAQLARLAPTRAESQSLQDITDEYDVDRTKLADAVAERQALLHALAKASTQGEIESLHARLALAAGAIARARGEYQAVARRGSNSSVEVSVLGDAHADSSESTLSKALHDAGDVLKIALAVAIVALAALVPLAILFVLLALGSRATRRRLRERVLSQR